MEPGDIFVPLSALIFSLTFSPPSPVVNICLTPVIIVDSPHRPDPGQDEQLGQLEHEQPAALLPAMEQPPAQLPRGPRLGAVVAAVHRRHSFL